MMFWRRRHPTRIIALLAFRNEMRFLPGWFGNVRPLVDGIVALDDGSTDGSAEFVARQHGVLELLRNPSVEPHEWDDAMNHRRLVEAAWRHDPGWLIAVDADERLERGFRHRAEVEIARAKREGMRALRVHVREIWDSPLHFRADGVWGTKSAARFFEARRDHEFHMQRLHCHWAPLNSMINGDFPQSDLVLYHLRMLDASDREARMRRYQRLDPDRKLQAIGYDYLTDTTGLSLERIAPEREYRPLPRGEGNSMIRRLGRSLRSSSREAPTGGSISPMPFIIGAPRSGTTLLRFMLDAHSQLAIPPETGFFSRADTLRENGADADAFLHQITHFPEHLPAWNDYGIESDDLRMELERLVPFSVADGFRTFYRMYARRFNKSRWGDKTPLHSKHVDSIRRTLPEARFIHIIRDGRDAALSLREMWFSPGREMETQAAHWKEWVRAARNAGAGHTDYLEVRYEELVEDPTVVLRRICDFIDLPYEEKMLNYHQRVPERLTEHRIRLRVDGEVVVTHEKRLDQARLTTQPPDSSRVLAWKETMTEEERERFESVAGTLLRELGYEVLER